MKKIKFCVFCGEPPSNKNKEHVIPKWLIKMTGEANRTIRVGIDFKASKDDKPFKEYSINNFTLPACEICNTNYSTLEAKIQNIMEKVLNDIPINSFEMSSLLDWFDKVRIGLWLMYYTLDENRARILPKFHINTRVGQYDRFLYINKCSGTNKRINFLGVQNFSFQQTPSVFGLIINNFSFINMSFHDLISRRIGFPFIKNEQLIERDGQIIFKIDMHKEGLKKINTPILRTSFLLNGNSFYQAIYNEGLVISEKNYMDQYSDNTYVQSNSIEKGKSKIISNLNDYKFLPIEANFIASQNISLDDCNALYWYSVKQVYQFQLWLDKSTFKNFNYEELTKEAKEEIKKRYKYSLEETNLYLKYIESIKSQFI